MGRNMAKKGKVAVIINYRLTPNVMYEKCFADCAYAVHWVYKKTFLNIRGILKKLLCYHSAGGQLAASLMGSNIFEMLIENPIKGCVLIDAFGLESACLSE